jgi:hypothetical protein
MPNQEYLLELYSTNSEFVVNSGYKGTELQDQDISNMDSRIKQYIGFIPEEKKFNYL